MLLIYNNKVLSYEIYLLNHVLHGALESKPLELDGDELVGAHVRTVGVGGEFFLREQRKREKRET